MNKLLKLFFSGETITLGNLIVVCVALWFLIALIVSIFRD